MKTIPTPCYIIDPKLLIRNAKILDGIRQETGCKILLALKGFAMHAIFPLLRPYLDGVSASSPNEARLGAEEFGKDVHVYSPAYSEASLSESLPHASHVIFNSVSQWKRFKGQVKGEVRGETVRVGLRLNPEHSEVSTAKYDPCGPHSRLGITENQFRDVDLNGISGFHLHTLCESNVDELARSFGAAEKRFGEYFHKVSWLNLGGGHHITREDYDIKQLCELIKRIQTQYDVQVILEPGEAVALNTGVLATTVLDIIHNQKDIAILDTSATAHMPDVLEMPYRPAIKDAGQAGEFAHTYTLGGLSCLAGDVIGEYSFREPLEVGQTLFFQDMAHYTMVKNTTFNGVALPSIGLVRDDGGVELVKQFGYTTFKDRLS